MTTSSRARADELASVTAWANQIPAAYLACRDIGHSWSPHTAGWEGKARRWRRELVCSRCRTERVQYLSATGVPISNSYRYAEDYLAPQGVGPLTGANRGAMRLVAITASDAAVTS